MLYGLYLSAAGAKAQSWRQDIIANNIANVDTTGFRRQLAVLRRRLSHEAELGSQPTSPADVRNLEGGVHMYETPTDLGTPGLIKNTGRQLDLAILGAGFFQVQQGAQTFLTRNGAFTQDEQGYLATADGGARVLGINGEPIRLDSSAAVVINPDGQILQNNVPVARIAVQAPQQPERMIRTTGSRFAYTGELQPGGGVVAQGHLEGSNANPIHEMTELIAAARNFELNMRMIQLQNDTLADLLQTVPRL
jgi:flagellar basal body rod protein FlgG